MAPERMNIMSASVKAAEVLAIPLGLINTFTGITAGIWLALLGEWGLIGSGILVLFISIFGLVSALMPGMLFAGPAAAFNKKGNKLGFYIFGSLSTLYSMAVLSAWCIAILYYFTKDANGNSFIPTLLWSYAVAIGPVLWISQKDIQSGEKHAMISTFFAQAACFLVILANLFTKVSLSGIIIPFVIVMSAGLAIQLRVASEEILSDT